MDFDALVAEAESVPVDGWEFSWFDGRATEGRPPWGYQRLLARRLPAARRVLDLQTGGGEVTAGALRMSGARPRRLVATESWPPNVTIARQTLQPWNATVLECADTEVPVAEASFDLVVSRHPVVTPWRLVAVTSRSRSVPAQSVRSLLR